MTSTSNRISSIQELLGSDAPSNWGKWGPDDEVGSLNYLQSPQVLKGISTVQSGDVFTLQVPWGRTEAPGDPLWPGRQPFTRKNVMDESSWDGPPETWPQYPGGAHYCDDVATLALQGSTQYDSLGHAWYDGKLWNGYDARSTIGAMNRNSILPIAEKGVVGRGVLIDMARHRNKNCLSNGETFDHRDVEIAAAAQGVTLDKRDILCIRTGITASWFERNDPENFFEDYNEPGLTYSRELVEWFQGQEIPNLVTDSFANEVTSDPNSDVMIPLHSALMRNLGVVFTEVAWLEDLADACAADGRYDFLYTAAPLKIVGGAGAPVNPIVIR
ncbi:cyclase family protein [Rhodococcus sp. T7]|uniref:cyclase family protein n=1 Tax=Rhodococcus sp. T7 TaxID=627444 RepID=UPI00135BAF9B|nr:cyclase family protein [Rhodococcus sp. T7]KAF0957992.1 hypothetical protein MLGJGCBP_09824 [Rhodococcus sp. T7]KAF0960151.1 hypothetical protein MLGJGCBP_06730 [Rhodococcus sp. T7]